MTRTIGRILKGSCLALTIGGLLFAQKQMPKTSTEKIHGSLHRNTQTLMGTVAVRGRQHSRRKNGAGDIRSFTPPIRASS